MKSTRQNNMRRNGIRVSVILFLWFCLLHVVNAQVSTLRKTVNGKEYYVHTIEKGQTVYGISKMYGISDKDLIDANPQAASGIRAGDTLLIPVKKETVENKPKVTQPGDADYIRHKVEKGETLYRLSVKYGVSVEEILKCNEGLDLGLKEGSVIRIPRKGNVKPGFVEPTEQQSEDKEDTEFSDTRNQDIAGVADIPMRFKNKSDCLSGAQKKKEYRVALLLPLDHEPNPENKQARVAFQFLGGVEVAKELHLPSGVTINWEVFNTGEHDDTTTLKRILASGNLNDMDLLVGPLYASGLGLVSAFAATRKIPLISPTVRSPALLRGNPYVIKATPSPESFTEGIADYLVNKFNNIIVYYPSNPSDSAQAGILFRELKSRKGVSVHQAFVGKNSPMDFVKSGSENIIYYPSKNELAVSGFLTGLRNIKKTDNITVMGEESWLRFRNFDPDYYNQVNLHVPVTGFVSNEIEELQLFVTFFTDKFKTSPEVYAYKGFDVACFVTDMLALYGNSLPECVSFENPRYTLAPFRLKKISGGGFDQYGVLIVRISDYKLYLESY
jgi:LysM repeat protein